MPTVRIFGQEVERKHLLIGGGLLAAAVAVVVFLRARAANAAVAPPQPADQGAAQPGEGMSVSAPTGAVADQYQQQMNNSELEAQKIANTYQSNLVSQQEKQFAFQQKQNELLAPQLEAEQSAELNAQTQYYKRVASTRVSCPGNQAIARSPDGQLYCRQKTSGGFLGLPVGDIVRAVSGFVGGVEAAAPEIGYSTAKQAASYYTGREFPALPSAKTQAKESPPFTPPIAPVPAGHGYEEHYI